MPNTGHDPSKVTNFKKFVRDMRDNVGISENEELHIAFIRDDLTIKEVRCITLNTNSDFETKGIVREVIKSALQHDVHGVGLVANIPCTENAKLHFSRVINGLFPTRHILKIHVLAKIEIWNGVVRSTQGAPSIDRFTIPSQFHSWVNYS